MVDAQRGVGIVGGIEKLFVRKFVISPIRGGDPFRFGEAAAEENGDGAAGADGIAVAVGVEHVIEIEDGGRRDTKFTFQVTHVVGEAEASFGQRGRCQERF